MATHEATPPPRRERQREPAEDDQDASRSARRDRDHDRDRPQRRRESRSPDDDDNDRNDRRQQHHRSRRHREDASPVPSGEERSSRRHRRHRSRSRSRSGSRDRRRHRRSRSAEDASSDRAERKRRHEDRSTSPRRPHRSERRRDRSESPRHSRRSRHDRHHHRSRSRSPKRRKALPSESPPRKRSNKPLPSQEAAYRGSGEASGEGGEPVEKQQPNFKQTGLLAREANTVAGTDIVLKYNEPPDARKPPARDGWRLYVFKGQDVVKTVELCSRSCWLIGREAAVADLLAEHPSTSKQHAVLQFRHTTRVNEYGDKDARVRPYLIDLESSNGTSLNGKAIEPTRFVELMDKDVFKIGLSEREYVLMLPPPDA